MEWCETVILLISSKGFCENHREISFVNIAPKQLVGIILLRYRMLLPEWTDSKLNLVLAKEELDEVDRFSNFGSCISPGDRTSGRVSFRIQKAGLKFTNLKHLRSRRNICLPTQTRIYTVAATSILLYLSET